MSQAALAQVKIDITGINNDDLENNVRLLLSEIKTPLGRINDDKYKQSLIVQTQKALQAFGYYDANVSIDNLRFVQADDTSSGGKLNVAYSVVIALGTVAMVDRVVLINDFAQIEQAAIPNQLRVLLEQVKQLSGKPINHDVYETLKNRLKTYSLLYGYFDFSFPLHKLIVQPGNVQSGIDAESGQQVNTASKVIIHWIFYFGRRYQFGDIKFLEDTRGQDIARSVKPFKEGQYFDQSKVGDYSIDMQSTDYFASAIARANAKIAENFKVPIEVILTPKPKDTFEFGVGISTDTGPRFTVDWSRPWVNLRGHSLGARLYVSRPRKSAQLNYRIPMANPLNDFFNIQGGLLQVDENETQSNTLTLAAQRQWGALEEDEWDKIAFVRFEQESFIQGLADEVTTRLLLPGVTYSRIRKRGEIFVSWGDLQQITVEGGSQSLLSDIDFFKVLARTKWIREIGKHRLLFRADAGAISTNDFDRVPSTQRFFAGGDQSIRGFGLNEVSDADLVLEDDKLTPKLRGGRYLAVASVEYAYPVAEKFRAAAFVDAGNAGEDPLANIAYGYGIGVHWLSPIGTVRVYFARGVSDFDKFFRIHLVIGPGL